MSVDLAAHGARGCIAADSAGIYLAHGQEPTPVISLSLKSSITTLAWSGLVRWFGLRHSLHTRASIDSICPLYHDLPSGYCGC